MVDREDHGSVVRALARIVAIVRNELATDTEGSDENTEQDCEAYDQVISVLKEEGLIS